ncbi:XRE family transcriptional regulator [Nocardia camponoti]|uniref:Uncharacterized protein n=1 Tax=Nocardia camponoti TaxID=1616106 RepID=A0A917QKF1_9NOCA|nr:XRE family transcriptional regulator [Nocardia camponoti]GGK54837.1 hypothetical protein GCM10011591_28370 [Nocardia camponoti]
MPRPRRVDPRELTDSWPTVPASTAVGEAARLLALNLRTALGPGTSVRGASARTGVNHAVIACILAGTTWPDTETVARLETGLGVALWPVLGSDGIYRATAIRNPRNRRKLD